MTDVRTVVAGLDFSEGSEAALVRAADLAERLHARLHLVHAASIFNLDLGSLPQPEEPTDVLEARTRAFAEAALGGDEALDVIGPEVVVRRGEVAAEVLLDYVREVGADLVVVGTHGRRGVRHLLAGSVAEEVVRLAPCPVLTVPNAAVRTAPGPDAPVLVPVDFAASNRNAVGAAKRTAALFEAPVELVHVVEETGPYPVFYPEAFGVSPGVAEATFIERAERHLRAFDAEVGGDPAAAFHICVGRPHREIIELAEERGAGLVVMATHGLTGLEHALVGSVTERTIRSAPCPVLSMRHLERPDRDEA
ncbi:MAG: universal stress protein [Rhodothermales bacterium]